MEDYKLREYETVLREIINNRYNPISPKKMKELFSMDELTPKTKEYDAQKTSLQRILDFYTSINIITIITDSTLNEINKLKKRKSDVKIPLEERDKLKPYIKLLSNKYSKSSKSTMDDCIKYSVVTKITEERLVSVVDNNKDSLFDESLLPNNFISMKADKDGYRMIMVDDKDYKLKYKMKTLYKLVNEKFENLEIDYFGEDVKISDEEIVNLCIEDVVDLGDKEVSPYHIMYRLFLECDFKDKYGKIESPIEFQIPNQKIDLFIQFFLSMVLTYDYNIKSSKIVELTKSDIFQNEEIKRFITNTVTKIIIKLTEYQKGEKPYPLQLLLDLISFKSKINIKINIDDEAIDLSKTSIKKLIIRENELDIKLKNTTVTLTDINQIKSIQSYDSSNLSEDIEKLKTILTEYPTEVTASISQLIKDLEIKEEMFVF